MYDVYKCDITTEFIFLGSCGWDSNLDFWRCKELVKFIKIIIPYQWCILSQKKV